MAATGNTTPLRIEATGHSTRYWWMVTATSVTSFTITLPGPGYYVITATSQGTALTAQPAYVPSTGIYTQAGVTQGDVIDVEALRRDSL